MAGNPVLEGYIEYKCLGLLLERNLEIVHIIIVWLIIRKYHNLLAAVLEPFIIIKGPFCLHTRFYIHKSSLRLC